MKRFASQLIILLLLGAFAFPLAASEKKDKRQDKKDRDKQPVSTELNVPIPVGRGAEGVHIPYYDEKGKLQMDFSITSATRVDLGHLNMTTVNIETYNPDGSREMSIQAKSSVLDLNT